MPPYRACLAFVLAALPFVSPAGAREHERREVDFDRGDGVYTPEAMRGDFGNGAAPENRRFVTIRDQALNIRFVKGKKVVETGLGLHVNVPGREAYELSYRIRFPDDFEAGLHGKQLGLSGGRGYDGGRGEEARANGDGWSVRVQFDATEAGVRQSLYVYHAGMTGKYGGPVGSGSFMIERGKWYSLRLRATVPSSPDAADGRIELWCDGERKLDARGLRMVTKEEGRNVNRVRIEMFPGGGGIFPTKDHLIEIDDVVWSAVTPER